MIYLQVDENVSPDLPEGMLEQAAQSALQRASESQDSDLTLVLTDDVRIQGLNREFLETDAPTDVLSFPADYTDPDTAADYLGDVIISYPRAQEQAQAAGHPLETELQLLVVHGVLHLLGYDHAVESEKAEMWALQAEVLGGLGIDASKLPI